MAMWRTKGYATTTVADICAAAGVSKALFYFYFPRKEDVLFEVGVLSTQSASRTIHAMLDKPYEIDAVLRAALTAFERSMARNPPELIIETILEGYRHEHRILLPAVLPTSTQTCSPSCSAGHRPTARSDPRSTSRIWPTWRRRSSARRPALGGRRLR